MFDQFQASGPELVILGAVDEDVDGAVEREEQVAGGDHHGQVGHPVAGHCQV